MKCRHGKWKCKTMEGMRLRVAHCASAPPNFLVNVRKIIMLECVGLHIGTMTVVNVQHMSH